MELTAGPEAAGDRLDAFLAGPLGSRSRAERLITSGSVSVDGVRVQKRFKLLGGETILIDDEPADAAGAAAEREAHPAPFVVAYEDDDLLVVDKPAGVVVHPARGHWTGTLAQALADRTSGGEDPSRIGIVHRLDKDTSGLLVVARSEEVHRRLKEALQERTISREYLALVDGRPPARTGTIDAPIGRDRAVRIRQSTDTGSPREARTHFALERALARHTLLRVQLETGRTHQIRVHLQAIGHPVAGDPEYGRGPQLGLSRQFLHAARLRFEHPITGQPVDVTSALPDDLAAALDQAS